MVHIEDNGGSSGIGSTEVAKAPDNYTEVEYLVDGSDSKSYQNKSKAGAHLGSCVVTKEDTSEGARWRTAGIDVEWHGW